MIDRKELKQNGKKTLKRHYWLLLAVCLIAMFFGSEFAGSVTLQNHGKLPAGGVVSISGGGNQSVIDKVYLDLAKGDLESGETLAQDALQKDTQAKQNSVLGGSRGALSSVINTLSSGTFLVKVYAAADNILHSKRLDSVLLISLSLLLSFCFYVWIRSVYLVISRRIFLEARTYEKVGVDKFLFLLRHRSWLRTGVNLLVKQFFLGLWSLTIIGGIVKAYAYFLVPYILAENPKMTAREAITLSRRLMDGHKWDCFKLQLSLLLWQLLGSMTFGIVLVAFVNPYKVAVYSEFYAAVRQQSLAKDPAYAAKLNDRYLFEKPAAQLLQDTYVDVLAEMQQPLPVVQFSSGVQRFFSHWFGVVLYHSKQETAYEQALAKRVKLEKCASILDGTAYPLRLFPTKTPESRAHLETVRYARNYSLPCLILMFFAFSLVGWLWEVSLHLIMDGVFVNRGVMYGPWLPIYGSGSVMILLLLKRLRSKPIAEFVSAVVLCGCVEYFTSWYLEMAHNGVKWWDYSGYFLNLNGRICAEGLMVFGIGGMLIVYAAAPLFDNLIRKINTKILIPLCLILVTLFAVDQVYSHKVPNTGKGITDYAYARMETTPPDTSSVACTG